ncbi:MAG: ribonuclease P protein component [Nitrospirae bacterium]|nr:ribonuclease P protein component [Nitrospirota bacterium]
MLEKKYRIDRNQTQYILKKGEDSISKLFIIRYIKNNKEFNRYCSVVSKKLYTKAVDRNKLRRQIYHAIRAVSSEIKLSTEHLDIVLIPKKRITKAKFEEIEQDLMELIINHGQTK